MERAEWLKQMRGRTEVLYDRFSPRYWVSFGTYDNTTHLAFLQKFLERTAPGGWVLSAGCGAGRFDGVLMAGGCRVLGIDQSAGMLARAREHFPLEQYPRVRYEKIGLQELAELPEFAAAFDGVICLDALEHICPEDYPGILGGFAGALKPGGMLYITVDDSAGQEELEGAYQRASAQGLPVVFGEVVDASDAAYEQITAQADVASGAPDVTPEATDGAVYHYYPGLERVRAWLEQAGLAVEAEGAGLWYHHFLAKKRE